MKSGQNPNAASPYGETPLKQAYRRGRMDVFSLLLDHGADLAAMRWGPLHKAVALGDMEELRDAAGTGNMSARDELRLTPFLLACEMGEVEKTAFLLPLSEEEDLYSTYHREPALAIAAAKGRTEMVSWLLDNGFDVNDTNEFGGAALIAAAEMDEAEVVKILLMAGADIDARYNLSAAVKNIDPADFGLTPRPEPREERESFETAASKTGGGEVARMLIRAGAQPHDFDNDVLRELTGAELIPQQQITPEMFEAQKHQRFGTANPEPVACEYWLEMIRTGMAGYSGHEIYGSQSLPFEGPAIWCFDRFGMSTTQLPDGRWVQIAGEHEDFYDPDFCIYDDVVVHDGEGNAQIYIYPRKVFPPTDFHTATLVEDAIILIGSLGYQDERPVGETQVLRLDLKDVSIDRIETSGDVPGWISRHQARLDGDRIVIWGGKVWDGVDYAAFEGSYALSLATGVWERTDRE
ncbi:MAG: ankyrin repeat domain-containing protein [Proteobacteria bacterium]|nr:ankyrin repeat domain-containing protein [Pseudomonadota bacterium]